MGALIQVIIAMVLVIAGPANSKTILLAVHKQLTQTEPPKPLYTTELFINRAREDQHSDVREWQPMALDLDAPFTWHYEWPRQDSCPGCVKAVACDDSACTDLRTTYSYQSPTCPPDTNYTGSEDNFGDCGLCPVNVINPVTGICSQDVYPGYDEITFSSAGSWYTTYPVAGLSSPDEFFQFPPDVRGVLALSWSAYVVSPSLRDYEKVIALCLPSGRPPQGGGAPHSDYGVIFFGDGVYSLDVGGADVRSFLSYTALLKQPNSFGYFIGVDDIVIKKRSTGVPANTTAKISTIEPYTKLRSDIYTNVVRRMSKVTKRIPQAKTVAPFGLCFYTTVNGTIAGTIKVPDIDLVLPGGKKWTISTANSLTQVADGVACLAVVDGGAKMEPAIVIGTYQLEDNFVVFNMENSTFGFYSLPRRGSACTDFHV